MKRKRKIYRKLLIRPIDRKWSRSFRMSADVLAEIAAEVLRQHQEGKTTPIDRLDSPNWF